MSDLALIDAITTSNRKSASVHAVRFKCNEGWKMRDSSGLCAQNSP